MNSSNNEMLVKYIVWFRIGPFRVAGEYFKKKENEIYQELKNQVNSYKKRYKSLGYEKLICLKNDDNAEPFKIIKQPGFKIALIQKDEEKDSKLRVIVFAEVRMKRWPFGTYGIIDGFYIDETNSCEDIQLDELHMLW